MHREISHADQTFASESRAPLYGLTALIGVLIGLDLWPAIVAWVAERGVALPSWDRELFGGYRIALIAAILGGARALYSSIDSLLQGRLGADLALAIACVAAILFRKPLVAAEIVFIGMVGECLESFTFERTQRAVRGLVEVFPRRCWVLRDGQEVRVFTREVQVGDRIVVKPGGRVPVDGVVVDGRSAVDTSALTGESLPVDKMTGDEILAGSLNQFGALTIEARRVAEHTVAGQVIEMTARALRDKADVERTADRLARYFLPVVLALAAVTFLVALVLHLGGWGQRDWAAAAARAIDPMLAVLVVACPCALILATPAAIIAALGRLAGTGILIKGGAALERLAGVTAFAFDKTGTLSEGRLVLGDAVGLAGTSADELLRVAATAEQQSEHLLARLLLQEAASRQFSLEPVNDSQAHPGAGIVARANGAALVVGNARLLTEQGIAVPPDAQELLDRFEAAGQTTLLVARDGQVLGVVGVRDQVRREAAGVIAELRSLGIRDIALLTGDRAAVARAVADEVGISVVRAELLPQEKAEFIAQWRGEPDASIQPARAAMVGDGINDAPALARADVGLALGATGADVAAEAGDVVLMGDPLRSLPLLVRLSRETVRIIRQNILIFAFGVNGVGIVLTAWLWPLLAPTPEWYEQAPLAAVVYHQFGSLAVLLNAMRLLWFERQTSPARRQARRIVERIDHWLGHTLDPHDVVYWLGHHARAVMAAVVVLMVAGYTLSGLVLVGPEEAAVVRRFGRPLPPALGPGLWWRWPWPVENIVRVQPDLVRTVAIGYRPESASSEVTTPLTWGSAHGDAARDPDEAVMTTGDGNLVEIQATVRYTIAPDRLETYLFEIEDPEAVLRAAAESVIRETVAGRSFADLLTTARAQFQTDVLERLQERCRHSGPHGLGMQITEVAIHDLHPPQEVVPAYYEVAQAVQARDRQINQAEAERTRAKRQAESQAAQIIFQAQAETHETVRSAEAARARFLALLQTRNVLGQEDEAKLTGDLVAAVLGGQDSASAYRDYEQRRRERVAAQAGLTDFRLFWEALATALAGRDKILIDADRVPGRRHLFFADPEQLRVPAPVLTTTPRRGAPAPRSEGHENGS